VYSLLYYRGIVVDDTRDRTRLLYLLTERNRDGELVLRQRSDGACVHLGPQGCTVYEDRPAVCFDCRIFAAMGAVERCGPITKRRIGSSRAISASRLKPSFGAPLNSEDGRNAESHPIRVYLFTIQA
jgi:Fe-S-cluster containining protein